MVACGGLLAAVMVMALDTTVASCYDISTVILILLGR